MVLPFYSIVLANVQDKTMEARRGVGKTIGGKTMRGGEEGKTIGARPWMLSSLIGQFHRDWPENMSPLT